MKQICFVCTGNTCRSPFAEKLLSKYFKQDKILIKVCSAGLDIVKGEKTNEMSIKMLQNFGIKVKPKQSKKISKSLLKNCDLFITMTKEQKKYLPNVNCISFGELVGGEDIIDPYMQGEEAYRIMALQIDDYCKRLMSKINLIKGEVQ